MVLETFKIYIQSGDDWMYVEEKKDNLNSVLLYMYELQKDGNNYRLEKQIEGGVQVINFR
jgi:hypothetical protein